MDALNRPTFCLTLAAFLMPPCMPLQAQELSTNAPSDTVHSTRFSWSFQDNSYESRLRTPLSIHPDFQCIKISKDAGNWKNMAGQTFGLVRLKTATTEISSAASGYVELHDMSPQFMSWQLWRGNLGIIIYLEDQRVNRLLFPRSRLIIQLGWHHESQHASDLKTYVREYTVLQYSADFNNASARSFEFLHAQAHYIFNTRSGRWVFVLRPGYRYYPQPLLSQATRNLQSAYSLELGIHRKIQHSMGIYIHGCYESIQNGFRNAGYPYKYNWDGEPLIYRQLEAGLTLVHGKRECSIFTRYNHSNGRGLDFLRTFEQVGCGLRFVL